MGRLILTTLSILDWMVFWYVLVYVVRRVVR